MKKRLIVMMIFIFVIIIGGIVQGDVGTYLCGFGAGAVTGIQAVDLIEAWNQGREEPHGK